MWCVETCVRVYNNSVFLSVAVSLCLCLYLCLCLCLCLCVRESARARARERERERDVQEGGERLGVTAVWAAVWVSYHIDL